MLHWKKYNVGCIIYIFLKYQCFHNSGLDLYWIPFLYHYSLLNHLVLSNGNQEYNRGGNI